MQASPGVVVDEAELDAAGDGDGAEGGVAEAVQAQGGLRPADGWWGIGAPGKRNISPAFE